MGRFILAFAVVFIFANGMGPISKAHGAEPADDPLREFCVSQAFSPEGYGSGVDQNRCERRYPGLPSPFIFRCVSYLDRGFPTPLDKLACALYFDTPDLEKIAPMI